MVRCRVCDQDAGRRSREQICQEARADSAEGGVCKDSGMRFIVMGSRGLNALFGSILGSVSTGVLHHAPAR